DRQRGAARLCQARTQGGARRPRSLLRLAGVRDTRQVPSDDCTNRSGAETMPIRTEDLEYYRPADVPLLARFYRPEGQAPFPAVLEVHGGAWTSGDRFNNVP